jgi:hypothetical protein
LAVRLGDFFDPVIAGTANFGGVRSLDCVYRFVCEPQESLWTFACARKLGDANADRRRDCPFANWPRPRDRFRESARQDFGALRIDELAERNDELVSAEPRCGVDNPGECA